MTPAPLEFEKPIVELEKKLDELKRHSKANDINLDPEVLQMQSKILDTKKEIYANLSAWQRVQIARHNARPFMFDYIQNIFKDFVEIHGDRLFGDDQAMPAGFATLGDTKCVVIGHQKGRELKENIKRNFGSAHPEGYRKAMRIMRLAEKFSLPVISFIDTPGAYPGIGAEERHISEAIAVNMREMMLLRTPVIAVIIGEGGSGGALGIGVADRVLMLENSYYSVISPEGCAAILWKHRSHAPEAAEALKLTAQNLLKLKLIDDVIEEPLGGAHQNTDLAAVNLKAALQTHLKKVCALSTDKLLTQRYARFRKFGEFTE